MTARRILVLHIGAAEGGPTPQKGLQVGRVVELRGRWRENARARVGLDGPHRPLEQTPAICSSLRAGHPECNLWREKTIKVWQCPSRTEPSSGQPGRVVRLSRGKPISVRDERMQGPPLRRHVCGPDWQPRPAFQPCSAFPNQLAKPPRPTRSRFRRRADRWQPQRSMTRMGP